MYPKLYHITILPYHTAGQAIGELFETDDAIKIIKLKDIYETMETASDRCVDVSDVIEDIVLKYT